MPELRTPGQALLDLIAFYWFSEPEKSSYYQNLYFSGVQTADDWELFHQALVEDPASQDNTFTLSEAAINNDAERRYFETYFCYLTLQNNLNKIRSQDIKQLYANIKKLMIEKIDETNIRAEMAQTFDEVNQGICENPIFHIPNNNEYNGYLNWLKARKIFPKFQDHQINKLIALMQLIYLMQFCSWIRLRSPLQAYTINPLFKDKGKNKNRDIKDAEWHYSTRSQHLGVIKGHMPLPIDDILLAPQAYSHCKPEDYFSYNIESKSAQYFFAKLVNPYINGASGICLFILKIFSRLNIEGIDNPFTKDADSLAIFLRVTFSALQLYGGGHSLDEFAVPLKMPEVIPHMSFVPNYQQLDLTKLFLDNNILTFKLAIAKTLDYRIWLKKRKQILDSIVDRPQNFLNPLPTLQSIRSNTNLTNSNPNSLHNLSSMIEWPFFEEGAHSMTGIIEVNDSDSLEAAIEKAKSVKKHEYLFLNSTNPKPEFIQILIKSLKDDARFALNPGASLELFQHALSYIKSRIFKILKDTPIDIASEIMLKSTKMEFPNSADWRFFHSGRTVENERADNNHLVMGIT